MHECNGTTGNDTLAEGELICFELLALAEWANPGPTVRILSDTGASRSVLFTFRAGQRLKEHRTSSQILVYVLCGEIAFDSRGRSVAAAGGTFLQLESEVPHAILALSDAIVLVTMTPSPKRHSLSAEVFDKLTPMVERPRRPQPEKPRP
jgi:quercetin dioxygenase-like cupin family protein